MSYQNSGYNNQNAAIPPEHMQYADGDEYGEENDGRADNNNALVWLTFDLTIVLESLMGHWLQ